MLAQILLYALGVILSIIIIIVGFGILFAMFLLLIPCSCFEKKHK